MIKYFRNKLSFLDIHSREVVLKSASSTVVKVTGMIVGVLVSIYLGRTLGADGLGVINLSHQVANLLVVLCLLGMRQVIVKEVAIGHSRKDWQHIGNVMHSAYWINGLTVLFVSVSLILFTPWLTNNIFHEPRLTLPLIIAFIVLTPQVFSRIFSAGLTGFRKIWQSNLADQTLSFVVIGIILLFLWVIKFEITINTVVIVFAIGRMSVMIALGLYWRTLFEHRPWNRFIGSTLIKTALPLLLATSTAIIASNASTIILGWLVDSKQVGLYTVAIRIALITSFFLQITNASVSPKVAALFAVGKIKDMEKMVQRITRGLGIIGFVQLSIFVVFGKLILSLWGTEFIETYWILIIISIGQFFNICTGASGLILIMCGFERVQGRISLIFLILNLLLNYFFISKYGALGAAIATAISVIGINIAKLIFVKIKVGILTVSFLKI